MQHDKVGLIGIGLLGQAIAERLLASNFPVVGYDPRSDLTSYVQAGGVACEDALTVAAQVDRLILSLPNSTIAQEVVQQVGRVLPRDAIVVDTTTGVPQDGAAMSESLAAFGVGYLAVTVAGSSQQMRNHQATLLVGGEAETVRGCESLLEALGAKRFHVGNARAASEMKLVVNLAIGLHRAVLAEALAFGESLGFSSAQLVDILRNSPAQSAAMDAKADKMVQGDFEPQARLRQHYKDVQLILDLAESQGAHVPLSKLHTTILQGLIEVGLGDRDNSVVIEAFRREQSKPGSAK